MGIKNKKPKNNKNGWRQGYFNVENSKKYFNPKEPCIFRSSYEYKFMLWCERNENVVKWGSETFSIKYVCLETGKKRNYWIDFIVYHKNPKEKWLIEVKPYNQVKKAINFGKRYQKTQNRSLKKNLVKNNKTHAKNFSKWAHAKKFCKDNGYIFKIITEKFLNS